MTANTRREHTLLTRQNRCLQCVCKCNGAGVSHIVASEVQFGESGVRLLICHSTGANAQVAARLLSHTTECVGSERRLPETSDVMECLMNSHDDSTCGEVRLTLHLMPFCSSCGITETWAAQACLNYNKASNVKRQTSQRPSRSGVAKAKERHLISSLRACQHNLCESQMFQCTLQSQSDFSSCAAAPSTSI